jgi:predicted enzyme related to lactoylglutathione lyase
MAHDGERAREFYGALFGWEFTPGPPQLGAYMLAGLDGRRVAGIGESGAAPHRPVSWTTMLAAEDADAAAELVRECGGTVGVGPLNAGEEGRVAIAVDPAGAVFGIWQGGLLPGAEVAGVPGTVAWSELVTRESGFVAKFYEAVFGLGTQSSPGGEPDRVLLAVDGRPVAAVRGLGRALSRELGTHWLTCFQVTDVAAAVEQAGRLGARVLEPPRPSPCGRTALLADPEAAVFALTAPAAV